MVFEGSVDEKAFGGREDRSVDRGDIVVEADFAYVERGFQPLQNRASSANLNAVRKGAAIAPN